LRASEIGLIKLENHNASKGELYCKKLKGSCNNTIRLDNKTKDAYALAFAPFPIEILRSSFLSNSSNYLILN